MMNLKVIIALFLISTLSCQAKLTHRQIKTLLALVKECGEDTGVTGYENIGRLGIAGTQTTPDKDFVRVLNCVFHRADFMDCDGNVLVDNFAAFISDGHNNMDQLPTVAKECLARANEGTEEERSFQLYRCMNLQHKFVI